MPPRFVGLGSAVGGLHVRGVVLVQDVQVALRATVEEPRDAEEDGNGDADDPGKAAQHVGLSEGVRSSSEYSSRASRDGGNAACAPRSRKGGRFARRERKTTTTLG